MSRLENSPHVLILGGTADARKLARLLDEHFGETIRLTISLAGRTKNPDAIAGDVRSGGFGGAEGLTDYLNSNNVACLIDATHPFADTISSHAVEAADKAVVQRLSIVRPVWTLPESLDVTYVTSMRDAADALLSTKSERAFITTGVKNLEALAAVTEPFLLIRVIEPSVTLPSLRNARIISGKPPFTLEEERALMTENRIDTLISKESGGQATEAKLLAADELDVKAILIRRPAPPTGNTVATPDEAFQWIQEKLGKT